MNKADEDFECENIDNGRPCGKQAPDVQLRPNPLCKGEQFYICDDCLEKKQELAGYIKEKEDRRK